VALAAGVAGEAGTLAAALSGANVRRSTVILALQAGHGKLTSRIGSFASSTETGF
jgi:hypothetical protein